MRLKLGRWSALAAVGALAVAPLAARAQEIHPGEQHGLGLTGPRIPAILQAVAADPYKAPAEPACETIPAEILALDQVLGADADDPKPKKSYVVSYAERMAGGAIRGMVPYRGAIRFLTGADHKDHQLMDAARAGWARRGFLRGLEANLRCASTKADDAQAAETAAVAAVATVEAAKLPAAFGSPLHIEPAPAAAPEGAASERDLTALLLEEPSAPGVGQPGR
ncbi:MAG TPA: hypothetical protein VGC92_00385 [Phenylobacterium sp.]|jgi:hypothetical protein